MHGKDDVTYQYKREDQDVRYKIQEYFKTQIPYVVEDCLDGKPDLNAQYNKAVNFIKNQNKPVLLSVPNHAVTAYKIIHQKDKPQFIITIMPELQI